MAIYTHSEVAVPPSAAWQDVDAIIQSISATEVVLANNDGTLTVLIGSGFAGTTGAAGTLTSGTIAAAARTNSARTVTFETITGFSYAATALSARLPETSLVGAMSDIFSGSDTLNGHSGDDFLRGFAGADTLVGGTGINGLIGNAGNDTLIGGTRGNNAFDVNLANYAGATGAIVATLGATSSVTGNASVGTDTLIDVERVRGSAFDDTFVANSGFSGQYGALNLFEGMDGNDTITGNGGTRVFFSQALDAVTVDLAAGTARSTVADLAGVGIDTITGGVNGIHGSAFGDTLLGSDADVTELFRGLAGADTIDGRGGDNDLVDYVGSPNGVNVDLQAGTAQDGFGSVDTLVNIESARGSEHNDTITGNDLDNILVGQGGDDTIFGGAGNDLIAGDDGRGAAFDFEIGTLTPSDLGFDTIDGGTGTDTAGFVNPLTSVDVVAEPANNRWLVTTPSQGTDTLTNVEIVRHDAGRFLLVGASGFATAADAAAAATRPGDIILTGTGNAPAIVDLSSSTQDLAITTGGGDDQIVLGSGDDTVTSGAGNDVVQSGSGDDTIVGGVGTGDDIYDAGEDGDTVVYSSAVNSVAVDLRATDRSTETATNFPTIGALLTSGGYAATTHVGKAQGADIGTDALIAIENIVGGQGADELTGNAGANEITGGAGSDTVDGDGGSDTLVLKGNRADYVVTGSVLDFVIADGVANRDGTDTVRNMEFVRFADGTASVTDLANDPPSITSNGAGDTAAISVNENELNVTFVTANDPDGDVLTFSIAGGADADRFILDEVFLSNEKAGFLILNGAPDRESPADADGNNVYEVVVEVSDGNGGTDTQTISVTVENVNEAPSAVDGAAETNQGVPVTIPLSDLISDPETPDAGLAITAASSQGTVVVNGTDLVFTPDAGFSGEAVISYAIKDPSQFSSTAMIRVTVNPVAANQPPVADADGPYVAIEDTLLQVSAAEGVLAGDTDPENGPLTAELDSTTSSGTLTLSADGSFSYQPNLNFDGSDSFVYRARDAAGLTSAEVTVQIDLLPVNDAASITGEDTGEIEEDTAPNTVSGTLVATDVDSPATFTAVTNGGTANGFGTYSIGAGGLWTYTLDNTNAMVDALDENEQLADSFSIQTADGTTKVVNITIHGVTDAAPNLPPVVSGNAILTASNEDALRSITAAELLANVSDPDGDALSVSGLQVSRGTVVDTGNGTWTFTPIANDDTGVTFTYQVTDNKSAPVAATATLDLLPLADPAVIAGTRTGTVTEDDQLTTTGLLTVTDPDAGEASFQLAAIAGTYGTLTLATNGSWTYALNNASVAVQGLVSGQSEPDRFTVRSVDGTAAEITITVNGADEGAANVINGTNRSELIKGTVGADIITALKGSDIVNARDGDDVIKASIDDGSDFYYGDGGSDTVDYSALTKSIEVCLGEHFLPGIATGKQSGTDILASIENVIGSQAGDKVVGNKAANIIEGGAGDDKLMGDGGSDTFVFKPGFGTDRIGDFDGNPTGGQDMLDITAFGIATTNEFDMRVDIADAGADTLVTIDGDTAQTIRLVGIGNATTVTVDDFRFL